MSDQALQALREQVLAASADKRALRIVGGGTKDFYGGPLTGEPLHTGAVRGIVSYEPTELVVTARCGTLLTEVEAALEERGQMLAFEPPRFGEASTIGGVVAAGLSGPRRVSAGSARDFVLGAALLDGAGRLQYFGGQVMKNVAGYDVSRLLCGSLGILGVIAEVSLKVLPKPAAEATVSMTLDEAEALRLMNAWAGQPLPISSSEWHDSGLRLRLSGARAAVDAALTRFERDHGAIRVAPAAAAAHWTALRDQRAAFFEGDAPLWRLSVPSSAPPLALPGRQLIEWGGALRWFRADLDPNHVRAVVRAVGGSATRFRGGDPAVPAFDTLSAPVAALHRRLKDAFDPAGLFNPGRMTPEL